LLRESFVTGVEFQQADARQLIEAVHRQSPWSNSPAVYLPAKTIGLESEALVEDRWKPGATRPTLHATMTMGGENARQVLDGDHFGRCGLGSPTSASARRLASPGRRATSRSMDHILA
jgi:hypothetical protein